MFCSAAGGLCLVFLNPKTPPPPLPPAPPPPLPLPPPLSMLTPPPPPSPPRERLEHAGSEPASLQGLTHAVGGIIQPILNPRQDGDDRQAASGHGGGCGKCSTLIPDPYHLHPPRMTHPSPFTLDLHPKSKPSTLNYKPYTLHPTPYTLHHKPKPQTLDTQNLKCKSQHPISARPQNL